MSREREKSCWGHSIWCLLFFRCLFHWLCGNIQLFRRFPLLKSTIPRSITLGKCWDLKKQKKNNVSAIDSTGNIEKFIVEKKQAILTQTTAKWVVIYITQWMSTRHDMHTHSLNWTRTRQHAHVLMTFSFPFNMLCIACKLEVYSNQIQCEFPVFQTTLIGQEANWCTWT